MSADSVLFGGTAELRWHRAPTPDGHRATRRLRVVAWPQRSGTHSPSTGGAELTGGRVALAEVAELASEAVDPLDVAARLEASGYSDRRARELGHGDVFALGEELYRRFGTKCHPDPDDLVRPSTELEPGTVRTAWQRGAVYLFSALAALALLRVVSDPTVAFLVGFGVLFGWGWTQGVAFLANLQLGYLDPRGARHWLRRGLLLGPVLWLALTLPVVALGRLTLSAAVLPAGIVAFMMGTVTLAVLGHELALAIGLMPSVILAFVNLASPDTLGEVQTYRWLALTLIVVLGFALLRTARADTPLPTGRRWTHAVPYFWNGLAIGGLVLVGASIEPGTLELAALPVIIGMGLAELELPRMRLAADRALSTSVAVDDFVTAAHQSLVVALARFTMVLVLLTSFVLVVQELAGDVTSLDLLQALAFGTLGASFFLVLVLVAAGRVKVALHRTIPAVVAAVALRVATDAAGPMATSTTFFVVSITLVVLLYTAAREILASPLAHR